MKIFIVVTDTRDTRYISGAFREEKRAIEVSRILMKRDDVMQVFYEEYDICNFEKTVFVLVTKSTHTLYMTVSGVFNEPQSHTSNYCGVTLVVDELPL